MMPASRSRCDIFCRVIDNFGDAGVCWRLARQLRNEYGLATRLWIDNLPALAALLPALDANRAEQHVDGVIIRRWTENETVNFSASDVADTVIEAFACDPPSAYVAAMAMRTPPPRWINLDYLGWKNGLQLITACLRPIRACRSSSISFFPDCVKARAACCAKPIY